MFGKLLDQRQLVDRLGVVGHRAVAIDGDGHRPHAQEAEATRPKAKTGRRQHRASPETAVSADASRRCAISAHDDHAQPEALKVAGDEAGQDVQRRAAFARLASTTSRDVPRLGRGEDLDHFGNDGAGQRAAGDDRRQLPPERVVAAQVGNQQLARRRR